MYSRNRYCKSGRERADEEEYTMSPEEEELYSYNLPPRYDGSRFSQRCRQRNVRHNVESQREESNDSYDLPIVHKTESEENNECPKSREETNESQDESTHLLDGIGSEELLLISLILTIAGGEDSGEMLLFLILLLLHG